MSLCPVKAQAGGCKTPQWASAWTTELRPCWPRWRGCGGKPLGPG